MVLLSGLVEFLIVDTHPPSFYDSYWNEFAFIVCDHCKSFLFFGTTCIGLTQLESGIELMIPASMSFMIFFLTTLFRLGFNLRRCSLYALIASSRLIKWMQRF